MRWAVEGARSPPVSHCPARSTALPGQRLEAIGLNGIPRAGSGLAICTLLLPLTADESPTGPFAIRDSLLIGSDLGLRAPIRLSDGCGLAGPAPATATRSGRLISFCSFISPVKEKRFHCGCGKRLGQSVDFVHADCPTRRVAPRLPWNVCIHRK